VTPAPTPRSRKRRAQPALNASRPLISTTDHGKSVWVNAATLGVSGDRWIEPFLAANAPQLDRLGIKASIDAHDQLRVRLIPGSRIGATPLLSPATRRVVAGLLVTPRFRWSALGAVLGDIGFALEPQVGGAQMVPGSARAVPTWLLAAPVLRRLEALLRQRKRGFVEREDERASPRGRVDWSDYATRRLATGRWASLLCRFPDPDDDPDLVAAVRWTLRRIQDDLESHRDSVPGRLLRLRAADLEAEIGPGASRRPNGWDLPDMAGIVAEAKQAMGWIAEERGLGGAQSLDGLSWELAIEQVWEAWVDHFISLLAPHCGLVQSPSGQTARSLNWRTALGSMRRLIPDSGLSGPNRRIWVDAKYKAHLQLLAHQGWSGLGEDVRDAHRADLHQALAYTALDDAAHIDSILVYPQVDADSSIAPAIATLPAGRRTLRLILLGLPFGFRSEAHRQQTLAMWHDLLIA
jgi:hypothetical protein